MLKSKGKWNAVLSMILTIIIVVTGTAVPVCAANELDVSTESSDGLFSVYSETIPDEAIHYAEGIAYLQASILSNAGEMTGISFSDSPLYLGNGYYTYYLNMEILP